jgi:glycosyltransferase involved in cell wall biosynthesis
MMHEPPLTVLVVLGNAIVGGMETAVLRLVQALPREAIRVIALVPFEGALADDLREAGAIVHATPMPADPRWRSIQVATVLVRQHDVDVIHAHLAPAHLLAAIVGHVTHVPVVATVHAMHVAMADLEAHLVAGTELCLVSEAARLHALAVGAVPERIRVVRNAVDAARFKPAAHRAEGTPPRIGFAGRLSAEKNPLLFVDIAARVVHAVADARFAVAGDGPLREPMEDAAMRLGVRDRFTFRGTVEDMPAFYGGIDALVATSLHEGTPLALLEAMACGLPVAATAVGGVPEIVQHGVTGHLFPSGDADAGAEAVARLAGDPQQCESMGRAARARVLERFDWRTHVAAVTAMWRDVASGSEPAAVRATTAPTRVAPGRFASGSGRT